MIHVAGLSKSFGANIALKTLDLDLEPGRAYGIIGPNGSGKTTLFRVLTGLIPYDQGVVEVLGYPPKKLDRRRLGYMPQTESLYQDLTLIENITFYGEIYGVSSSDLEKRIRELSALMRLEEHEEKLVEQLSGGLARRTSLACAIVHQPELLLLDEPTVGVDPKLRLEFWDEFERLKKRGATLLVSTHHLDEASRCDELVLLRDGTLLAKDTPAGLLESTGRATIEGAFLELASRLAVAS